MTTNDLFSPVRAGRLELPHRIVMAPMTRLRATEDGTPTPEMAVYYAQRATAGLIVTEGIWPEPAGQSEWRVPGLSDARHVDGWRRVTAAVHAAGGTIVAQLMHGGRKGHPLARWEGSVPAGPSAVATTEPEHLPDGSKAVPPPPGALTGADIDRVVGSYVRAAANAMAAGFDGVEVHAANSYLPHQFLADNTNLRTDEYGGDVAGRIRFPLRVARAVADTVGADRTAIRLSPGNPQFEMVESDPAPVYRALLAELDRLGLAYLHLTDDDAYPALADLRPRWSGTLIANVGENRAATTASAAVRVLAAGLADAVSFGRGFLVNPDLPHRLRHGLAWNPLDQAHLYTPGPVGYTDYPAAEETAGPSAEGAAAAYAMH
jgi:N-ethylmaleimide reductase